MVLQNTLLHRANKQHWQEKKMFLGNSTLNYVIGLLGNHYQLPTRELRAITTEMGHYHQLGNTRSLVLGFPQQHCILQSLKCY